MRAKPFILVTSAAATLAALSACTCNGCPDTGETGLVPTLDETGDTGDGAASCPVGDTRRAVDPDAQHPFPAVDTP